MWPTSNDLNQFGSTTALSSPMNITGTGASGNGGSTNPLGSIFGNMGQMGGGASGLLGLGQLGIAGLGTLGNIWSAWNANQLANQEFNFDKNYATTNLNNSVQSYNTNLNAQATARYAQENNPGGAASYIAANQLAKPSL